MCKSDNKENPVISSTLPSANTVEHELKHRDTNIPDWTEEIDQNHFVEAEAAALKPTVSSSPEALKPAVSSSSPVIQQQQSRGRRGQSYHPRRSFQYSRAGYRGTNRDRRPLPPVVTQPDPGKTVCLLTKDGRSPGINISQSTSNGVCRDPRSRNYQNTPRNASTAQKSHTDVQKIQANVCQSGDKQMGQKAFKENEQRRNEFPPGQRSNGRNDRNSRFHYNQSNFPRPPAGIQQNRTFADVNSSRRTHGSQSGSQTTSQGQEVKTAALKPNVFGEAIPVDTHVKLMEIEQKKWKEMEERNKKKNVVNDSSKKVSPNTSGASQPETIEKEAVVKLSKTFADAASTNVLSIDVPSAVNLSETSSIPPKLSITTTTSSKPFKSRNQKPYIHSNPRQMFYLPQHYQQFPHHIQPGGFQVPAQYYGQFAQPQFQPAPQVYYHPQQLPQQLSTTYTAYPQVPYQHVPNQLGAAADSQQYGPQVHQQYMQQPPMQYNNGQTVYYMPSYYSNATSNYGQHK